jgi:hypothetical protein
MKIEFDVWVNKQGEVHLASDDDRLYKGINIRAKDKLESTEVLRQALAVEEINKEYAKMEEESDKHSAFEDKTEKFAEEFGAKFENEILPSLLDHLKSFGRDFLEILKENLDD